MKWFFALFLSLFLVIVSWNESLLTEWVAKVVQNSFHIFRSIVTTLEALICEIARKRWDYSCCKPTDCKCETLSLPWHWAQHSCSNWLTVDTVEVGRRTAAHQSLDPFSRQGRVVQFGRPSWMGNGKEMKEGSKRKNSLLKFLHFEWKTRRNKETRVCCGCLKSSET